jgi:hypothetical protein
MYFLLSVAFVLFLSWTALPHATPGVSYNTCHTQSVLDLIRGFNQEIILEVKLQNSLYLGDYILENNFLLS